MGAALQQRLQMRPMDDPVREGMLNLLVTGAALNQMAETEFGRFGLRSSAYKVLRILRGSPEGLARASTFRPRSSDADSCCVGLDHCGPGLDLGRIAAIESIPKWHLVPTLGPKRLDAITNEQGQRLMVMRGCGWPRSWCLSGAMSTWQRGGSPCSDPTGWLTSPCPRADGHVCCRRRSD